jgi:TolB-like protein/Flp pilus assembly protein TadD
MGKKLSSLGEIDRIPFRIGAFEIFPERNAIERDGRSTRVEALIMDVLCALAEQHGAVVSRDALISHIWYFNPGADESLTRAISILRKIFRSDGEGQPYIETVWRRGYRLAAPVVRRERTAARSISDSGAGHAGLSNVAPDHVPSYSVAVLGFDMLPPSRNDSFLADGFTRDLTALLSRVPRLRVTAYSSAAHHKDREVPITDLCRLLGARYLVSGTLTRLGDQIQLRAALMDGLADRQVWAQRVDEPLDRFFAMQDGLVLDVSTSILSELQIREAALLKRQAGFNLDAYELVQYSESLREHYSRETASEIIRNLRRALELDPGNAAVHASLATQLTQNVVSRFSTTPAETFAEARKHIDQALRLDANNPDVLTAAGIAATMMGNARLAVRQLTRALRRDPNNVHALAVLGWQVNWLNAEPEGTLMIKTAERRAPHHPRYSLWAYYRGHCEVKLGNFEAAIEAYRTSQDRNPLYHLNLVSLAAALATAQRDREAEEAIQQVLELVPDYTSGDYHALADRMPYMFGSKADKDAVLNNLHRVWRSVAPEDEAAHE